MFPHLLESPAAKPPTGQRIALRATVHAGRHQTRERLRSLMFACHCFILEDLRSTGTCASLHFEAPLRSIVDLYSGLLAADLDLTADSHTSLTGLCTLRRHQLLPGETVTAHLELTFFDDTESEDLWLPIGFA
jgi:hypothetical protein